MSKSAEAGPKPYSGKSAVSPLVSHGLLANWRFRAANFNENLSRHLDSSLSGYCGFVLLDACMLLAEQSVRNTVPTDRPVSFEIAANEAPLSRSFDRRPASTSTRGRPNFTPRRRAACWPDFTRSVIRLRSNSAYCSSSQYADYVEHAIMQSHSTAVVLWPAYQ